ncbi:hypothetical protein PPL_00941 [Heterostelium album PN500]|uniref:Ankyrin repeat protein n=1 Tax=Heterostelium pallidum (strain ATCC 26659 / Pp 5 / PN500) TaxID=670386 RepID=D3AXN4_HETP5|nr:hypothetical protein PPL_00941 [Heterostelium album PN500]EFA85711.1 hypothetical protein PPL_00941 [Heterostelium album PN500]|eukprot:XP_020437817.1 hypothetical protein PPL_00941 [Heterostelium album PN500]
MNKDLFTSVFNNIIIERLVFYKVKEINRIKQPYSHYYRWKTIAKTSHLLIGNGYFDLLKELLSDEGEGIEDLFGYDCTSLWEDLKAAIKVGRFDIFKYLCERFDINQRIEKQERLGLGRMFKDVIKYNRMEMIKYLVEHVSFEWNYYDGFMNSPLSNCLEMVQYLWNLFEQWRQEEYYSASNVFNLAAKVGSIEIINWLLENHPEYRDDNEMFMYATESNQMEVVRYLLKLDSPRDRDCLFKNTYENCIDKAARNNNLAMMKLFHQNNFPDASDNSVIYSFKNNNLEMLIWLVDTFIQVDLPQDGIEAATERNNLEMVKWLTEHTTLRPKNAFEIAAQMNHFEILKYLHSSRTESCSTDAMDMAASQGHIHIVKWLHENRTEGCSEDAIDSAAYSGNLNVIQFLHENRTEGCSFRALDNAIARGRLDIIKWLSENRTEACSVDSIYDALESEYIEIVGWLLCNRSEFSKDFYKISDQIITRLIEYDKFEEIDWILNNHDFKFYKLIKYQTTLEDKHPKSIKTLEIINRRIEIQQKEREDIKRERSERVDGNDFNGDNKQSKHQKKEKI